MKYVRRVAAVVLLCFVTGTTSAGGIALVDSTMTLVPSIEAELLSVFDANYGQSQVSLSTPGFSDSWLMTNSTNMPATVHSFASDDGLAQLSVVLDSALELSDETWGNIERFDFRYAHPGLNDVQNPTTWLTMSDVPVSVPESSGLVLLALGFLVTMMTLLR